MNSFAVSDKEEEKRKPHDKKSDQPKGGFVTSKWEAIDETELEAQGNVSAQYSQCVLRSC